MSITSRVKQLAQTKGINIGTLEAQLGFGDGIVRSWKKKDPSADSIKRFAKGLHTTADYLLELTDSPIITYPTSEISEKKLQLLFYLQEEPLLDEQIDIIMQYLEVTKHFSDPDN